MGINLNGKYTSLVLLFLIVLAIIFIKTLITNHSNSSQIIELNKQAKILIKYSDSLKSVVRLTELIRQQDNNKASKIKLRVIDLTNKVQSLQNTQIKTRTIDSKIPDDSVFIILKQRYVEDSISTFSRK